MTGAALPSLPLGPGPALPIGRGVPSGDLALADRAHEVMRQIVALRQGIVVERGCQVIRVDRGTSNSIGFRVIASGPGSPDNEAVAGGDYILRG